MMKRTILSIATAAMMSGAYAQSDGRDFDAAIVLVPGLTVERSGVIYGGDYSSGILRPGDIVRSDLNQGDRFYILTSDGSAISIAANSEIYMDGTRTGWNVFRVTRGSANVDGNVHNGYVLPSYFNRYLNMIPQNLAVSAATTRSGYLPTGWAPSYYPTQYGGVYNTPAYGVIDPVGMANMAAIGNYFYTIPYRSSVLVTSPWWW